MNLISIPKAEADRVDEIDNYRQQDEHRLTLLLLQLRNEEQDGGQDMQEVLDEIGRRNKRRPFSAWEWLMGRPLSVIFPMTEGGWRAMKFLVEDLEARKRAKPKAFSAIDKVLGTSKVRELK